MVLKLHGDPMSTSTTRVMLCLHEKAVDFELVPVNLFSCEHKQPSFLAMNPFGQVPVIEDDDLILFESRAITVYIAQKYKETGTDLINQESPKESALIRVWSEVESHHFDPAISAVVHQLLVAPLQGKSPDQTLIDENLEKLKRVLDVYEEKLSKTKYLAGDFYSLADLHHISYTYYFMKTPYANLVNDRAHVKAWWEDVCSRPASEKVAKGMTFCEKKE